MELKEAIFDAHRITEEIRNHAMKKELTGLWNCIIENIEPLRNALDVICKHYPEDRWTATSKGMPKPEEYVWVCDKSHKVDFGKLKNLQDSDWYGMDKYWMCNRHDIIAWRPINIPEPYYEPEKENAVEDIWHPVSEDPPKKYSNYWVQLCDSNGNYVGMHDCVWTDSGFFSQYKTDWHWVGNPQYTKIVAWRPLPERFIGDEDGNG